MGAKMQYRLLWERVRTGDEQAYFDLYAQLYPELVRFGVRTFADSDLASGDARTRVSQHFGKKNDSLDRVEKCAVLSADHVEAQDDTFAGAKTET